MICEWFALCDRLAAGTVAHPAFPEGVPVCQDCATQRELPLVPFPTHKDEQHAL